MLLQKPIAVVSRGKIEIKDAQKLLQKEKDEDRKRAEMMIPKKNKHLYSKIMFSKKKERQEVGLLIFF